MLTMKNGLKFFLKEVFIMNPEYVNDEYVASF